MVGDRDDVAGRQRRIDAARRVRDDQRPHAERGRRPARRSRPRRAGSLRSRARARTAAARSCPRSCRRPGGPDGPATVVSGKAGQRRVRYGARALQAIGDAAQPGPEHHRDVGAVDRQLLGRGVGRAPHAIEERRVQLHDGASPPRVSTNAVTACRNAPGASTWDRWPALGDRDEARARDRGGDLLHLGGGRHLVLGAAHDQRRAGDRAQLGRSVGAVAQRLDAGAQAGGAGLGARAHVRDQRGRRVRRQQARQDAGEVGGRPRVARAWRARRRGRRGPRRCRRRRACRPAPAPTAVRGGGRRRRARRSRPSTSRARSRAGSRAGPAAPRRRRRCRRSRTGPRAANHRTRARRRRSRGGARRARRRGPPRSCASSGNGCSSTSAGPLPRSSYPIGVAPELAMRMDVTVVPPIRKTRPRFATTWAATGAIRARARREQLVGGDEARLDVDGDLRQAVEHGLHLRAGSRRARATARPPSPRRPPPGRS